jgi:alpha-amylase
MSGGGNDIQNHRNSAGGGCATWKGKSTTSATPSPYYTHNWTYEKAANGQIPANEFPSAAVGVMDFHCERGLSSWTDPFQLNYGWLSGLTDIDTEGEYMQDRIAAYMTDLISIGFSGYRIDAAKHIKPESLSKILAKVKANLGGGDLPADFITYLEVLIGGEAGLLMCNEGDYQYTTSFDKKMSAAGLSDSDISKVKIWSSDYPKEMPICGSWIIPASRFAIENDCHDDQNPGSSSRDMQDKGSVLIKDKDVPKHRAFEELLFTRTDADWKIRLVLSSYSFMNDGAAGVPDGKSDCAKCVGDQCSTCNKSMKYSKAHDPSVCGYTCEVDGAWKEGVYTRVHRDYDIIQAMRGW